MSLVCFRCRHNGDITEYLVKWKELGYDEATWEVEEDVLAFQAEVDKFKEIMSRQALRKRKGSVLDNKDLKRRRRDFKPFKKTPKFLVGGIDQFAAVIVRSLSFPTFEVGWGYSTFSSHSKRPVLERM